MSNIQDLSIKKYITNPKIFCDLYNGGIFEGRQLLLPQHLQSLPSESYEIIQDKKGKQKGIHRYHDVTLSWQGSTRSIKSKFGVLHRYFQSAYVQYASIKCLAEHQIYLFSTRRPQLLIVAVFARQTKKAYGRTPPEDNVANTVNINNLRRVAPCQLRVYTVLQ